MKSGIFNLLTCVMFYPIFLIAVSNLVTASVSSVTDMIIYLPYAALRSPMCRIITESVPNLNVSLISDNLQYSPYKYVLSDHGSGLATSRAFTHFCLGSHLSCTSNWPGSYQRQIWHHQEETCFPLHFSYLPVAIPRAVGAGTTSKYMNIEHRNERREREERNASLQNYFIAEPTSAMAEDMLSLLGCGRGVLQHS